MQFLEAIRLTKRELLAGQFAESRPGPQRQGVLEPGHRGSNRTRGQSLASKAETTFVPRRVELVVGDRQPVSRCRGRQSRGLRPEDASEP